MVSDTEVVIEYLRKTYGKQKILLIGHSWGSVLGLQVAERHPEWLYAYVGVGQLINAQQNELEGYDFALSEARAHGNADAVKELEEIAPYPGDVAALSFGKIGVQRKWLMYYGGLAWGRNARPSTAALNDGAAASHAFALCIVRGSDTESRSANETLAERFGPTTWLRRKCRPAAPKMRMAATAASHLPCGGERRDEAFTLIVGTGSGATGWNRFK